MRRRSWLVAVGLLALGAPSAAAVATATADSVIAVTVHVPPGSFPPEPIQVSLDDATLNEDVVNQLTTMDTYVGYQGEPGKSGARISYGPITGMSFAVTEVGAGLAIGPCARSRRRDDNRRRRLDSR